jgi:L-xylulokinase
MPQYLLGIDNGNTVCKATLFDQKGRVIYSVSTKVKTYYPQIGWSERNIDELWQANVKNIKSIIHKSGINPLEIAGIGNTGHGNGLYLLDKSGKPVVGIQSIDTRAGNLVEEWQAHGLQRQVYPLTQQQFWASQTNTLLAWFKLNKPKVYDNIGAVLLCKDLINYLLTQEIATDFSDISVTNLFNIHTKKYDDDLIDIYKLKDIRAALPPVFQSHEIIGKITKKVAKQTGLAEGTPVIAGMLDVDASMIGSGIIKSGEMAIVAGTWSVNALLSEKTTTNPNIAMTALFAKPNQYLTLEASATSITNLEWFINQFCADERRKAKRMGISIHEVCDELVRQTDKNLPMLFHPFLHGSNVQSNARAGFYGLGGWNTKADMMRAIYEGIVFGHLNHIKRLRESGEVNIKTIRITGGGSRSPVLSQMFADVLNVPVEVPNTTETGTWGVAIAAGIAMGIFKNYEEAIEETVSVGKTYFPKLDSHNIFNQKYQIFQNLINQMEMTWNSLNQINIS